MPGPRTGKPVTQAKRNPVTTREGKRSVTTYIGPRSFAQLQHLAIDEGKPVLELVREALDLLFKDRRLPVRTAE